MIKGSSQNHVYTMKICSGHFPMNVSVSNNKLSVKNFFGEKVPRVLQLKSGVDVVTVSKIAGHKRLSTTERYLEFVDRKNGSGRSTHLEEL